MIRLKRGGRRLAVLVVMIATGVLAPRSTIRAQALTVERIFGSAEFASRSPGPFQWLERGDANTVLEPSTATKDGVDIVRYVTATGAKSVLVSAAQLTPAGAARPLDIEDYHWSDDGKQLLVFTNSQRVLFWHALKSSEPTVQPR